MMDAVKTSSDRTPVLLAFPFRPFFLLTAFYGALLVGAWGAFLLAGLPLPLGVNPAQWHSHELLFGMVPAAIAGFLLTAICNWTGAPPLRGRALLALVLLWLAGRVAMWFSAMIPLLLVAVVDLAFLPVLAIYAARVLTRAGNRGNLPLAAMIGVLALGNLAMHLGFNGVAPSAGRIGEILAMDVIAVIMLVIGGRITPAFTANWLRMSGRDPAVVQRDQRLDAWVMASALLMVPADLVTGLPWLGGIVALAAASIAGWRLVRWRGWHARAEPLLWILHLGIAWVVIALLIKGVTPFLALPFTAWMHALGAGAMGTLILGVMTRVALGHTGRTLKLPTGGSWIYALVTIAAVMRLVAAFGFGDYRTLISLSAAAWAAAFILFLGLYWSILSRPRADGRPG